MRKKRTSVKGKKCPECQSTRIVKAGFVYDSRGRHQRYRCLACQLHTIHPKRIK